MSWQAPPPPPPLSKKEVITFCSVQGGGGGTTIYKCIKKYNPFAGGHMPLPHPPSWIRQWYRYVFVHSLHGYSFNPFSTGNGWTLYKVYGGSESRMKGWGGITTSRHALLKTKSDGLEARWYKYIHNGLPRNWVGLCVAVQQKCGSQYLIDVTRVPTYALIIKHCQL